MALESDIAIVGAGPAGSACAATLAEQGYDVTLIDKDHFPREKACGDGLTPEAITVLDRLDLGDFLSQFSPIEGLRVALDHRRGLVTRFDDSPGRCVPRASLDGRLVNAAVDRGARLIKARVQGFELDQRADRAAAILAGDRGATSSITAKRIVACDGATSVLRRDANFKPAANAARAWAIRGYYATERRLDDLFDVYMPLEVNGALLVGYGWVFPVGDRVANIGVGYLRPGGVDSAPRFNAALAAFVDELRVREARRFGDIEALGKPIGAPIAANFNAGSCSHHTVVFAGDAAGLTDTFTGEGISAALGSGSLAAEYVHRSLTGRGSLADYGSQLDRQLPRESQDLSVIARAVTRVDQTSDLAQARPQHLNFLLSGSSIGLDADLFLKPNATPVAVFLSEIDPPAAALLEGLRSSLLTSLSTTFPFAKPMIVRELDSQGGPVYAATLICAYRACGGEAGGNAKLGGQAAECLVPFAALISKLGDRPREKIEKLNNALAILSADFAVSKSLVAVAEIGPAAAIAFARTAQQVCEGGMMDAASRYDLDRSDEHYLAAVERRVGSVFGFSAALGAEVAGDQAATADHLHRYGRMLGVAHRISEDIAELDLTEERRRLSLIASLRNGKYGLPLLLAVKRDPALRQMVLAQPSSRDLTALVERVESSGALAEVRELLDLCIDSASDALECAAPPEPSALRELPAWVGRRATASPSMETLNGQ